ncbi:hypothetical protein V5P93_004113 [Actinokineospora auranticolor]|uniref:Uncharacterized protein n=1 Tax=Actinokineospora auranticolor TaxID=155976 RepID=A0A2S6GD54_9PSEU|nr:hypothetical protein [Actinokineospora auranticolor]PPK63178.1 hypothetical protein CLV40_13147 [Actinokineospora auranticolor]
MNQGPTRPRHEPDERRVTLVVSVDDPRAADDLGARIGAAIERSAGRTEERRVPLCEPEPEHSIQDLLAGRVTWDELTTCRKRPAHDEP